jgi:signal transduction histidine kinase
VVKHSDASETSIRFTMGINSFELVVEDNGRGFKSDISREYLPNNSARLSAGNGLENMARRMEEIGGHCQIQSAPGQGTRIVFKVPLKTFVV